MPKNNNSKPARSREPAIATDLDFEEAKAFLDDLEGGGKFLFQVLDDGAKARAKGNRRRSIDYRARHGTLETHWKWITEQSALGAGAYVCINRTSGARRRAEAVTALRAVTLDLDGSPLPETWPLQPHKVVETSPGRYQVWWFITSGKKDLADWSRVQMAVAEAHDGDGSVHDLPRVFRLPGTLHQKDPDRPFLCRVIEDNPGNRYKLRDFLKAYPAYAEKPEPVLRSERAEEPPYGWDHDCDVWWSEWWLANQAEPSIEGELGDINIIKVYSRLWDRGISRRKAVELMAEHWNPRCEPPWDVEDLDKKSRNAYRSAKGDCGAWSAYNQFHNVDVEIADEPANDNGADGEAGGLRYRVLSNVEPEHIHWLWKSRFAFGKISILASYPGVGKTTIACYMAAVVSNGGEWPDGGSPDPGKVLFMSAEDDAADTLVPRLMAAGANLENCIELPITIRTKSGERALNLIDDLERLSAMVRQVNGEGCPVRLVIIDPITAYMGTSNKIDTYKNSDVRAVFGRVKEWASKHKLAVLCITHFNKGNEGKAINRITDSLAFTATARSVWTCAPEIKDDEPTGRQLMLMVKMNVAENPGGLAYRIESAEAEGGFQTSKVVWDAEPVFLSADDALALAKPGRKSPEMDVAMTFLREKLAGGPVAVKDIYAHAEAEALSRATLQRAKKRIGIVSERAGGVGGEGQWMWKLPNEFPDEFDL